MKYAALFIILGIGLASLVPTSESILARFVITNTALSFLGVGLGYGFLGPNVFMKRPDGQLSRFSYVLFWPYYLLNSLNLLLFRVVSKEGPYDQIGENLFLGCRLFSTDRRRMQGLGISAVLDVTCEFQEVRFLREQAAYHCIPVLDARAPTLSELEQGVRWLSENVARGPTYVHCALGHGRSATFLTAYLLYSDTGLTVDEAILVVSTRRPGVGIHPIQFERLKEFKESLDLSTGRQVGGPVAPATPGRVRRGIPSPQG